MRIPLLAAGLAIGLTSAMPVSAQVLRNIGRRAAEAVERKANAKLDEKLEAMAGKLVDNSFDAVFGPMEDAAGDAAAGAAGSAAPRMPFTIGSNATTEARYAFDLVLTYEIETLRGGTRSDGKATLVTHFSKDGQYTGTKITSADTEKAEGEAFIIFDVKNSAMVMLMSSKDGKFSVAYDWKDAMNYANATAQADTVDWSKVDAWRNYQKIGTKRIAGFTADGYRAESDESTVEIWVTRDAALASSALFGANGNVKQMRGRIPAEYPTGVMLELVTVEKRSGDRGTFKVTNVNRNARVAYDMADYPRFDPNAKK